MGARLARTWIAVAVMAVVAFFLWSRLAAPDLAEREAVATVPGDDLDDSSASPKRDLIGTGQIASSADALELTTPVDEAADVREPVLAVVETPIEPKPAFEAAGQILSGPPLSEVIVRFGRIDQGERFEAGFVDVDADGGFGPVAITLDGAPSYWFRLEGADLTVEEVTLAAPEPGAVVTVDFEGHPDELMWFYVFDIDTEEPLPDAEAIVSWKRNGITTKTRGAAREDGYVRVPGCPTGSIRCLLSAPGYASSDGDTVLPPPEPMTHAVGLKRVARLQGRVSSAGMPVADFVVGFRALSTRAELSTIAFSGQVDGSFEVDAPMGEVELLAFAEGYGQSATAVATVGAEQAALVELELTEECVARGRVVDQDTEAPLPHARVQLFASIGGEPLHPLGPAQGVKADGTFEVTGVSPRATSYTVTAPEYSAVTNVAVGEPGRVVELGTIALVPTQALTIRLESDHGANFADFFLRTSRAEQVPVTAFDADGVLTIENVDIGQIQLHVVSPDLNEVIVAVSLYPREPWEFVIPVDGPCSLTVEIRPEQGHELPSDLAVHVMDYAGETAYTDYAQSTLDGFAEFSLPCTEYSVRVSHANAVAITEEAIDFERDNDLRLEIDLGSPAFYIRLIDPSGVPVANAEVTVGAPGAATCQTQATNSAGMARFPFDGERQSLAAIVVHEARGVMRDILFSLSGARDEEVEVVLVADATLEIRVMDGDVPVANVECGLVDPTLDLGLGSIVKTTDAAGFARWKRVGEGTYDVVGARVGYEVFRDGVRTSTAEPQIVQIRRASHDD